MDSGRARAAAVRIGHINDEFGEVLAGLAAGQRVVLNPDSVVTDGSRVKPR